MHSRTAIAVFTTLLFAAPLAAKEIKLPDSKPQVSLDIPDNWSVSFDEAGLQAVSPETNSFVYGKVLKRPKDEGNTWLAGVLAKLQARGVVFETKGAPAAATPPAAVMPPAAATPPAAVMPAAATLPAAVAVPKTDTPPSSAGAALPVPSVAPDVKGGEPETQARAAALAPATAFGSSSAPAPIAPPVAPANLSVPSLALLNESMVLPAAPHKGAHLPFHALPYKNTMRNGTPVDVELLTFILPDKSEFFLLQESGQTDERMTGIIDSVKRSK